MSKIYKLEFEAVMEPKFYSPDGKIPNCTADQVPGEYWHKSEKETDNPWQQYNTLKQWQKTGEQLIRNVKLSEMTTIPEWKEVVT